MQQRRGRGHDHILDLGYVRGRTNERTLKRFIRTVPLFEEHAGSVVEIPVPIESVDSAEIYIDIQVESVEGLEQTDAATIYFDIQPGGSDSWVPTVANYYAIQPPMFI